MGFRKMLKQLADELKRPNSILRHLKHHVLCHMRGSTGSSHPGSELLRGQTGGIRRGQQPDEVGSTLSHPEQRRNWITAVPTQYKRLAQIFTIRPCHFR